MTVYEYGGDIIVIDVGMGFPDDDMYGIDVVIPDFSYLIKNKDRIRASSSPTDTRTTSAPSPICCGISRRPFTPPA